MARNIKSIKLLIVVVVVLTANGVRCQNLFPQPGFVGWTFKMDTVRTFNSDTLYFQISNGTQLFKWNINDSPGTGQVLKIDANGVAGWDTDSGGSTDSLGVVTATVLDTIIAADIIPLFKAPANLTMEEVAAHTDQGTVTFNIETRSETTPNTAGTDVMTSDLVADSDQQETTAFDVATINTNLWVVIAVTSVGGAAPNDPALFSVTMRFRAVPTKTHGAAIIDTVKAGDVVPLWKTTQAITITEVAGWTNQGSARISVEQRAETTPNTVGTDVLSPATIDLDTNQEETTSFNDATVPANTWVVWVVDVVAGGASSPQIASLTVRYTVD